MPGNENASRAPGLTPSIVRAIWNTYFPHGAAKVVEGFAHVLKDDGFVGVLVPDLGRR